MRERGERHKMEESFVHISDLYNGKTGMVEKKDVLVSGDEFLVLWIWPSG